jgi:uncharacterized membrane protein YbhN (UPF0104 family)
LPEATDLFAARARRARRWWVGARLAAGVAVLLVVVRAAGSVDVARAAATIEDAGAWLALVPLPTLAAMALDAEAWRRILIALGQRRPWRALLALRLGVESVVLAVPGGAVAGEAMKLTLLGRRLAIPLPLGAASLTVTKTLLTAAAAVYLGAAALTFALVGPAAHATNELPLILAAVGAGGTALLAVVLHVVVRGGRQTALLVRGLGWLPVVRLRRWLLRSVERFHAVDTGAGRFFQAPLATRARCFGMFLLEWLIEGLETFLILRCVSAPVTLGQALVLDGVGSLLRSLTFFVPAGLGFQDGAQVLLLRSFGFGDAPTTGAAFIFIKRTKELFWIVTGGLILTVTRDAWRQRGESSSR